MSDTRSLEPDPSVIGGVSKAPFAYVPDPFVVFARRAERFRTLAQSGNLAPYLSFLAAICDAQGAILAHLAEPVLPAPELIARARQFDMPPLDRGALKPDAALRETCRKLFDALASVRDAGRGERPRLRRHARGRRSEALDAMIASALADSIPEEAVGGAHLCRGRLAGAFRAAWRRAWMPAPWFPSVSALVLCAEGGRLRP